MFSKNPSKESLRQMLEAHSVNAMLLDSTVLKVYAAEQAPSKSPYRAKRKTEPDVYQLEIERLAQAQTTGSIAHVPLASTSAELDFKALEVEAVAFMRKRCRK